MVHVSRQFVLVHNKTGLHTYVSQQVTMCLKAISTRPYLYRPVHASLYAQGRRNPEEANQTSPRPLSPLTLKLWAPELSRSANRAGRSSTQHLDQVRQKNTYATLTA